MCQGKPTPAPCVRFEERKAKKDGRCEMDKNGNKSV